MDKSAKDIELLQESIEHWERMRDFIDIKQFQKESLGCRDCACCKEYACSACRGCPIQSYTGFGGCAGTPYDYARQLKDDFLGEIPSEWKQAAQAEIDFLKEVKESICEK